MQLLYFNVFYIFGICLELYGIVCFHVRLYISFQINSFVAEFFHYCSLLSQFLSTRFVLISLFMFTLLAMDISAGRVGTGLSSFTLSTLGKHNFKIVFLSFPENRF